MFLLYFCCAAEPSKAGRTQQSELKEGTTSTAQHITKEHIKFKANGPIKGFLKY